MHTLSVKIKFIYSCYKSVKPYLKKIDQFDNNTYMCHVQFMYMIEEKGSSA